MFHLCSARHGAFDSVVGGTRYAAELSTHAVERVAPISVSDAALSGLRIMATGASTSPHGKTGRGSRRTSLFPCAKPCGIRISSTTTGTFAFLIIERGKPFTKGRPGQQGAGLVRCRRPSELQRPRAAQRGGGGGACRERFQRLGDVCDIRMEQAGNGRNPHPGRRSPDDVSQRNRAPRRTKRAQKCPTRKRQRDYLRKKRWKINAKSMEWYAQRESNPCYRRERAAS